MKHCGGRILSLATMAPVSHPLRALAVLIEPCQHAARPHIFMSHPLACATMPSWSNVLAFWKKSGTEIM